MEGRNGYCDARFYLLFSANAELKSNKAERDRQTG